MMKMKKQKGGEVYMSPGAKVGGSPGKAEDVDLDEAPKLPPHLAKFFDKDGNLKKDAADRIAKGKQKLNIKDVTPKGYGPKEEVELDEAKYDLYHKDFSTAMQHAYKMAKKMYGITVDPKEIDDKVATGPAKPKEGKTNSYRLKGDKGVIQVQVYNKGGPKPFELNFYKEEADLDEAVKVGDTVKVKLNRKGKEYIEKGKVTKIEKDSIIVKHDFSHTPSKVSMKNIVKEEVEEGAAADARRAMRSDPDMKQRAFSKDVSATDDDEKGASKNIMMQLRKAVSLRSYDVEFADGKKQKVDQKIAQAVQNKYNSMRRPADKEKFQAQIAKSYKDMLKTIKSGYGEQKESILEKIERKIKENKNG